MKPFCDDISVRIKR